MSKDLQPVNWLSQNLEDEERRSSEEDLKQVVIIDDMPVPADFKLSPEEYRRRYEAKLSGEDLPEDEEQPIETVAVTRSVSWLDGSINIRPSEEEKPPIAIVTERPAATYDLDPEEYERIKEELEEERERTSGYYHDPDHFYTIGEEEDYEEKLLDSYCS